MKQLFSCYLDYEKEKHHDALIHFAFSITLKPNFLNDHILGCLFSSWLKMSQMFSLFSFLVNVNQ